MTGRSAARLLPLLLASALSPGCRSAPLPVPPDAAIDPSTAERLRALGYK